MTTATILSIVFNFVTCGDHTYRAIWTLDMDGHSELWVNDGDNHDTFAVVVIMIEYIVGHVLKAITYHHLLLKICTCDTIRGCATIKINHENKVICTWIVMHWATIRICTTNWVNMVRWIFVGNLIWQINLFWVIGRFYIGKHYCILHALANKKREFGGFL